MHVEKAERCQLHGALVEAQRIRSSIAGILLPVNKQSDNLYHVAVKVSCAVVVPCSLSATSSSSSSGSTTA
jgi:hypothetical protein